MPFFKTYLPSAGLSKIIREIQVFHADWNKEKNLPPQFITCLANTEQNLYFFAHDKTSVVPDAKVEIPAPPVIVTGPKFKPVGLKFGNDHLMIKVAFHPTGTYRLLGADMQQTVIVYRVPNLPKVRNPAYPPLRRGSCLTIVVKLSFFVDV
ncbi:MAG: hypothetical protein QM763_05250 [Agriterribacter sp.]